jgi:citrate synthase
MVEATQNYSPGLEGVIAGVSQISQVNPDIDSLIYRGYEIRDLAQKAIYEEVAYLLLHDDLPNQKQLAEFQQKIGSQRQLPAEVLQTLRSLPKTSNYMDVLRSGVSLLSHFDPMAQEMTHEANVEKAIRLIAQIPTIITAAYRLFNGEEPIQPDPSLTHSQNFFYMLKGQKPDELTTKVFDTTMILYAEHGFNASTFAARVTASTLSDLYSAIVSAIGTLKGPLHGGANEEAMHMLMEIGSVANVDPWLHDALAQKKKIMGFGHRVYKKGDTRAPLLKAMGEDLSRRLGDMKWHEMADKVETIMVQEKGIYPNVDFPTSYIYYMMGLPIPLYTPLFAASRVAGWSAHVIEQLDNNRLIRPKSIYEGPKHREFVPLEQR